MNAFQHTNRPSLTLPALILVAALTWIGSSWAYVEAPMSLGAVLSQSTHIIVLRVEKVDRENNRIIYQKVRDLKGQHPQNVVKHNIGKAGFSAREWQTVMQWAETGKTAIFFHNGGASETFIDNYWYQAYPSGEWWGMSHAEPYLLRSYAGKPEKLIGLVTEMQAGREVIAPCMIDGNKEDLQLRRARVQRLKASLAIQDYNPKRDFVGWGGDDIRRLAGMPGFSHLAALGTISPEALAGAVIDVDGDKKPDLTLLGAGRLAVLQNSGEAFSELGLPGGGGGRAAAWADINGDGKPDLLLAGTQGPRLLTNLGGGQFRDDTTALPTEPCYHLVGAAWADVDGDGRPDAILGNGFHGLRIYRNALPADAADKVKPPEFGPWHLIGPFDNTDRKGFDAVYPPEQEFDPAKTYPGKGGAAVGWQKPEFPDGRVNDLKKFPQNENVVAYVTRVITCTGPTELPVSLGSDDSIKVIVNGKTVHAENVDRACAPDQAKLTLQLRPGKNLVTLKIGQGNGDWAFYFQAGPPQVSNAGWFEDATARFGLEKLPLAGRGLVAADFDGDGKPDLLTTDRGGSLLRHTPQGYQLVADSGLSFGSLASTPAIADVNGDGKLDVAVATPTGVKLFLNRGDGRFTDATAAAGDLARGLSGQPVAVAWGDLDGDGKPDLVVGVLGGVNRAYHNQGDGRFREVTDALGLSQRVFNSRGVAVADVNGDGVTDLLLVNEGQDSCLLLGASDRKLAARPPVAGPGGGS